jgi:hypothetical protein
MVCNMQCLNGHARRTIVKSVMDTTCVSIVCTLETKLVVTQSIVMETGPKHGLRCVLLFISC